MIDGHAQWDFNGIRLLHVAACGLQKENGLFREGRAHFGCMLRVITPNADNFTAQYREIAHAHFPILDSDPGVGSFSEQA
jgi:hypothetical protein